VEFPAAKTANKIRRKICVQEGSELYSQDAKFILGYEIPLPAAAKLFTAFKERFNDYS
jgi:hypothetical protein